MKVKVGKGGKRVRKGGKRVGKFRGEQEKVGRG